MEKSLLLGYNNKMSELDLLGTHQSERSSIAAFLMRWNLAYFRGKVNQKRGLFP
jgi:hypothetical protein